MYQNRPTPSENEGFLCKNEVLLVLGTKEVSDGRPFTTLAASFSFIYDILTCLLNKRCRTVFAYFKIGIARRTLTSTPLYSPSDGSSASTAPVKVRRQTKHV